MTDSVALTALVVSLVALFTTIGQLLQQYLATADGYRRCQASIMGLWSQQTMLRWRWKEFRFETTFVIPRIRYGPIPVDLQLKGDKFAVHADSCFLNYSDESLKSSMTKPGWNTYEGRKYYDSDQLACWVPLLIQLHMQGKDAIASYSQRLELKSDDTVIPFIQIIRKSWDFMPPEVVRPVASTTVSDIAVMARRLGMSWKTFDPATGSMRAEGNGHVLTSTMIRTLGTVVQYTYTSRNNSGNCAYIPVKQADKLGFGLVELDERLFRVVSGLKDNLDMSSLGTIKQTLRMLTINGSSTLALPRVQKKLQLDIKIGADFHAGLSDLIPLCSAMLYNGCAVTFPPWQRFIPAPMTFSSGTTKSREGFCVFVNRLRGLSNASEQCNNLSQLVDSLFTKTTGWATEDSWSAGMYRFVGSPPEQARLFRPSLERSQDAAFNCHTQMTSFLQSSKVAYPSLVLEHLDMALSHDPASTISVEDVVTYDLQEPDTENAQIMHYYFDKLPMLIDLYMTHDPQDGLTEQDVRDAWLSMMFRALCWQRCHIFLPDNPLSSEYWNSKMPVYIG